MKGNYYKTIRAEAEGEFVERKSRFIGYITPISTEEMALEVISKKKKEFYNATHNVYAYRLLNGIKRFSDDGEPQGTAGIPVLDILEKEDINNVIIVVTRYFGGVKLGGGGLIRAYSEGAKIAIAKGEILILKECEYYNLILEYSLHGSLVNALLNLGGQVISSDFTDVVKMVVKIEKYRAELLLNAIAELSSNTIETKLIKTDFSEILQ